MIGISKMGFSTGVDKIPNIRAPVPCYSYRRSEIDMTGYDFF
jgi:hypothetical protein